MGEEPLHNLPEQPNRLLGRDAELRAARDQLLAPDVRLLSLIGPPGVGKTRLAMAVAGSLLQAFPEGVWLIDLAPLKDPALLPSEIASTLDVVETRDQMTVDRLAARLRGRYLLLLLDNFEALIESAAWVARLLEQTPGLKILTTSRERLQVRWERVMLVAPLLLPELNLSPDLSDLSAVPSVALFVERAQAVNADFVLSPENAPAVAALCTHLDGLPLAIELAATRANVLTPGEILAYMDDRFRLLRQGAVDVPERHQTLKAAIDSSYESLPPALGQFLRQLAVFSGGFSLAAAEIVGEHQALNLDGLPSLIALTEKSLLNRARSPIGETRFTMLESVREYLLDRLRDDGELTAARRRHALYYLELAERTFSELKRANQRARFDLLESEHGNLRAALQWSLEAGERPVGARIAVAVWNFWWLRGHLSEGLHWLDAFLAGAGDPGDDTHLRLLEGAGALRGWQGDYEPGKALLMTALQIAQERGDQAAVTRILFRLGMVLWMNGKTEEAAWLAERIEACDPDADRWELAHAFLSLGYLLYEAGQDEAAERAFIRSLAYFQFTQEKHVAILAASKLALLNYRQGDLQEATQGMLNALETVRQSSDLFVIAYCLEDAVQLVVQAAAGQDVATELVLARLAGVLGAVDHWREMLSLPRAPRERSVYATITENLQRRLGEAPYLRAWEEGRSIPVERAIGQATDLLATAYRTGRQDRRLTDRQEPSITLSEREHQVLGWVAEGLSNQEIAGRLFITERTVRFHITSIFNKLGANNRAQAVAIANRLGLLQMPGVMR